jgi:uncharacterized protein YutE (UPF0331/DUF86 family)
MGTVLRDEVDIMYFVDREKIEERLVFMKDQLVLYTEGREWDTPYGRLALERIAHTLIESILDVGNSMIDGFIMRDPGSYDDIIDILLDEKVIDEAMSGDFKRFISKRKNLVQDYPSVDIEEIQVLLEDIKTNLERFPDEIRSYLENELGPVSAFKN